MFSRTHIHWLIRSFAVGILAFAALVGGSGFAFAHDEDPPEVETAGACTVVAAMPVYPSAVCIKHTSKGDEGVTETKNIYVVNGPTNTAAAVQQYFLTLFPQQGWTLIASKIDVADQEWKYTVLQGQRQVEVKIESQDPDEGTGTEITIEE